MSQPISSDAIAAAAEARLRAANVAPSPNSTPASTIESSAAARREMVTFKSKIRVIIDKEISAHSGADISTRCLALTSTLFTNVLDNPDEAKYRVFKSAQPRIAEQILKVEGAKNLLVACGFGTRTLDFKHEWFLAETIRPGTLGWRWQRLGWANEVLKERNEEIKGRADKKREMAERERAAEKTRKKAALAAAEEDRERVARRAQTEKLRYAREIEEKRKAELAKAMASPAETSTSAEAPGSFNAAGPPPPTAMDEDEDELAEDGDEDDEDGDSDEEKPLTKNWGSGGRTLAD